MREIKFRAWNTVMNQMFSAEEMAEDQMTLLPTGQFINVHSASTKLSKIYPLDVMIPMQFTGLYDKHGKEIYEGDYVRIQVKLNYGFGGIHFEENIAKITFQGGCFWWTSPNRTDCNWHFYNAEDREVIGNIYENVNPELASNKGWEIEGTMKLAFQSQSLNAKIDKP